jgi:hypothetical protein
VLAGLGVVDELVVGPRSLRRARVVHPAHLLVPADVTPTVSIRARRAEGGTGHDPVRRERSTPRPRSVWITP